MTDNRVTLMPGDHIHTEGVTNSDYHAVARAFMAAGAEKGEYPNVEFKDNPHYFGWYNTGAFAGLFGLYHCRYIWKPRAFSGGRTLTVHQVLTATNAGWADADADGWIPWHGGECPVDPEANVQVKFRCGETESDMRAGDWAWGKSDGGYGIIAYRLHQPEAKQWRGPEDGLPPVGMEVEGHNGRGGWVGCIAHSTSPFLTAYSVKVVGHDGDIAVVRVCEDIYRGGHTAKFRPILSDRERVIEAARKVIQEKAHDVGSSIPGISDIYAALYDAGALHMPKEE